MNLRAPSTKIWVAIFVYCLVEVVAIYAVGLVELSAEVMVLQLTAWTGGVAFAVLVRRKPPVRSLPREAAVANTTPVRTTGSATGHESPTVRAR